MADSSLTDTGIALERAPRSLGVHASTLLRQLHPIESTITEDELRIYGLLGLALEDRVERALTVLSKEDDWPWECFRLGEVECDGIACSPDILMVSKEDGSIRELSIKATWKSCRGLPVDEEGMGGFDERFDYYLDQCYTYATPLQTTEAFLLVYFVNGDYAHQRKVPRGEEKKPPLPRVYGWELEFTEQERDETWQALCNLRTSEERA